MAEKMRVLLVEDKADEVRAFENYFVSLADAELVGSTGSGYEALLMTKELAPDAVILDLELDDGNGLQYLYDMRELELPRLPYILVTTRTTEEGTLQNVRDNGGVIQSKCNPDYIENGPRVVMSFLKRMRPYFPKEGNTSFVKTKAQKRQGLDEALRKRIAEAMGIIGITTGTLSHTYIVEAILLGTKCELGIIDFENFIYPAMERRFGAKRSSMERLMRDKIEKTWSNPAKKQLLEQYYMQAVDPDKAKPELREFISYYAMKFR